MKNYIILFKILLISLFTTYSIKAADIIVNSSGISGTYTTISAAISAASSGDVIIVSASAIPYTETLNIDKSLTIRPFAENTYIAYDGDINITLDAISQLTLVGFTPGSPSVNTSNIFSVFNDTTRNSLTTIDIIDSKFNLVYLNQVKTSTYVSYSSFTQLYITHGDVVACYMSNLIIGKINCSYTSSSNYSYDCMEEFLLSYNNIFGASYGSTYHPSECGLFSGNINFGNVTTFSDTMNIINSLFGHLSIITEDFPVNIRNNSFGNIGLYLLPNSSKGTSQIINNGYAGVGFGYSSMRISFNLVHCNANNKFNFRDISIRILNNASSNSNSNGQQFLQLNEPYSADYSLSNLTPIKNSLYSYNSNQTYALHYNTNSNLSPLFESLFQIGPTSGITYNQNPSSEFLNLDLTLNTHGLSGGSYARSNYIDSVPLLNGQSGKYLPPPGFGCMVDRKTRITYLNLPTQIFDPASIKVKAKAVHGK